MGDLPTISSTTITTTGGRSGSKRMRSPTQKKSGEVPPWVLVMIKIMQYKDCPIHTNDKLDRFCINCIGSFCNECSSKHQGHKHIKIRRYIYQNVINRPDFQKHFDCSGIQGYVTNKNKVLFLRVRDNIQVKEQQNNSYRSCIICNQTLIDAIYCSIQCKVSDMKKVNAEKISVDNNITEIKVEEESDHDVHNATEISPKERKPRKGIPNRAPLF
uniref:protein RGF1 INDUCIBLE TRANSCRIPTION FACTOR 1-like n=1 Tax=Erigeron canadensis TaxID=72917 RepID=UPI001CB92CDA|nr:protein RGF1 INDUCIBLE TRANSCRIPTION FACTOR 1-like [Erigeron canadensis]